jgi:hypothetical protein
MVHVTTTICGFDTCQGVFDTIKIDEVCQCHTNVQNVSVFPQVFRLPPTIKLTVVWLDWTKYISFVYYSFHSMMYIEFKNAPPLR